MAPTTLEKPGTLEVAGMLAAAVGVHLAVLLSMFHYGNSLVHWLDNARYIAIARAIHEGRWVCDGDCTWHLWGFPFAIAAIADVFRTSDLTALIGLSMTASLGSAILAQRLFGGWAAAAAVALSPIGIEIAARGGSEPLFMALVFSGFLAWRRRRIALGAALAVLSAAVRPLGPLVVLAMAAEAAVQRRWRDLAILAAIGAALAGAYLAAVGAIAGDPFKTSEGYLQSGWGSVPVGWPFRGFVVSWLPMIAESPIQASTTLAWMALACVSLCLEIRRPARDVEAERYFVIAYALFLVTGTHVSMAQYFSRLALPIAPFLFRSVEPWIPRRRWIWWTAAIAAGVLGALGTGRLYQRYGY